MYYIIAKQISNSKKELPKKYSNYYKVFNKEAIGILLEYYLIEH